MRKNFLLAILFVLVAAAPLHAQSGKPKPAAKTKTDLRFRSTWGVFLSDTLPRPEVLKLLDSALVVRDQKNNKFPVISFEFTYEKKEPYLNDTTGKPDIYSEFLGDNIKADRLPALWSNSLKNTLEKGDVIYFDNIIVNYTGDKLYRAPRLRFTVR